MQENITIQVPFDFKGHFEKLAILHKETKEQMQKFNEEYNQRVQNKQDSGSSVLYGYMQEINQKWIAIDDLVKEINLFFAGGFDNKELTNLNHFLSTNKQLSEVNQGLKEATNNINDYLTTLQDAKEKLEQSGFSDWVKKIDTLKTSFIRKLGAEVNNMESLLDGFVTQKIKNFETSTQENFQTHINNFNANFSKSYQKAIENLENLNTTAQDKISILKKNLKITYLFYSASGLLIFILVFLSVLLFNEYRNYQNKARALTNIATRLEGKISINAQGQVTLSLAKLKTIFKEDKNSIYLTIKEE